MFGQFNKNDSRPYYPNSIIGNVHWFHSDHNQFADLFCIGKKEA